MQVLFCHDGPLKIDSQNNYYGIAHNNDMFQRYYHIADKVSVVIRLEKIGKDNMEFKKRLSKITVSPFEVIKIPNISSAKGLLKRKKAKNIIKEAVLNTDYVVARLPSMSGFIAIDYARKFNKPYLTEVVACPWDAYWNHSLKGKIIAPLMYFETKKRVKDSPYTMYVTNEFLQKRYPTKGESVNCSNVALKEFDENVLKKRIVKINNLKQNSKIIIGTTAAVNVRYKGQQYVIKALGKLKEQGITNFEYQLVGEGDQSYLRSVAKKYNVVGQVKFLGALPHNEVFNWLKTIDIYVQPSKQEGLPRALIEAMSTAVPAFGAKTAGIPELLEDKFIFDHTKDNFKQICLILKNFTKKEMVLQAQKNYKEAQKYDSYIIEERRKNFFKKFKDSSIDSRA